MQHCLLRTRQEDHQCRSSRDRAHWILSQTQFAAVERPLEKSERDEPTQKGITLKNWIKTSLRSRVAIVEKKAGREGEERGVGSPEIWVDW